MAENSHSRKTLVVALSIFVVLTIGLAVSTFYGVVEQNKLRAEAVLAKDKIARLERENEASKASAQAELDWLQKSLQRAKKETADSLNTKSAEFNRVVKIVEDRDKQLEQKGQEMQQLAETGRRTLATKERKIKELQNNNDRLIDVVNRKIEPAGERKK